MLEGKKLKSLNYGIRSFLVRYRRTFVPNNTVQSCRSSKYRDVDSYSKSYAPASIKNPPKNKVFLDNTYIIQRFIKNVSSSISH